MHVLPRYPSFLSFLLVSLASPSEKHKGASRCKQTNFKAHPKQKQHSTPIPLPSFLRRRFSHLKKSAIRLFCLFDQITCYHVHCNLTFPVRSEGDTEALHLAELSPYISLRHGRR
ncbi:hypothetical protein BKA64DRAFT_668697 [Cadophora sp. MPI-SDFR-AT-0126]|nr:hypothetical protein BKA64DRAFT_668697 [Leotiomycetes sp. MPI-SDFR-AT-0126]